MSEMALLVKHRVKPGRRDDFVRVWTKHVRPRVESNPGHAAYFFCVDESDPDVVCAFQVYRDREAMEAFLSGPWYDEYLKEVEPLVAGGPEIVRLSPVWVKG